MKLPPDHAQGSAAGAELVRVAAPAGLVDEIGRLIEVARQHVAQAANEALTTLYWQIGTRIRQDILKERRAEYGAEILATLGRQLEARFGRGFEEKNLRRMVQFAEAFPDAEIVAALRRQLGWSHFKALIPMKDPLKRDFYAEMCRVEGWSTRVLQQKIDGMLYERTALSKKPDALIRQELAERQPGEEAPVAILAVSFETVDDAADPLQVQRHKRDRRLPPSPDNEVWRRPARSTTLRHELASLRLFLGWATRKGIIASAPEIVLPPRDDRDAECLSPEEVKLLLSHIPETVERGPTRGRPLRPFFEVMYYQGLRDRTVSLLTWDDYDDKTGSLHVRKEIDKNRFDRTFVAFPETRAVLDKMRPDIVPRGTLIFGVAKRWAPIKKAAVAAGLGGRRISEHTLRHSRTTELCSGPDADLAAVAYLLGWRDVATLCARYFHPDKRHADAFVAKVSRR